MQRFYLNHFTISVVHLNLYKIHPISVDRNHRKSQLLVIILNKYLNMFSKTRAKSKRQLRTIFTTHKSRSTPVIVICELFNIMPLSTKCQKSAASEIGKS